MNKKEIISRLNDCLYKRDNVSQASVAKLKKLINDLEGKPHPRFSRIETKHRHLTF